jgi:hypothetical protein
MDMCPQGFMNKNELIYVLNQAIQNDDIKQIDEMVELIKNLINKKLGDKNE